MYISVVGASNKFLTGYVSGFEKPRTFPEISSDMHGNTFSSGSENTRSALASVSFELMSRATD